MTLGRRTIRDSRKTRKRQSKNSSIDSSNGFLDLVTFLSIQCLFYEIFLLFFPSVFIIFNGRSLHAIKRPAIGAGRYVTGCEQKRIQRKWRIFENWAIRTELVSIKFNIRLFRGKRRLPRKKRKPKRIRWIILCLASLGKIVFLFALYARRRRSREAQERNFFQTNRQ